MGKCTIDHSHRDVITKLENQSPYMPENVVQEIHRFLQQTIKQATLNELFHLLKKYDLSSEEEKEMRNAELRKIVLSN
ncbi:group-specific protein [Bacillus sp. es.036]|uniref:group-specific protein n=1 Tax=Bacillus sp. es.036 TaxID=1761764 RepID=UPI000BF7EFC0|nr:group-specific protein [Bacillus sp. es.036]PFG12444.1 hypothetical protein ATG70_0628 [Bacillus sp. es.036]